MFQTTLSLLPFLVLGFTALLLAISFRHRKKRAFQRQVEGLQWLSALKNILSGMQQHRGLSTGFLNGSTELATQIDQLQNKVSKLIGQVYAEDNWFTDNERWQAITQHWSRLSSNYRHQESATNLKQHNLLIQNVLYLIDDMAEEHGLLDIKSCDNIPLHVAWRELLIAAEHVGQARALGTAIVSAHQCDSTTRIRMKYLCQKIDQTTREAWQHVSSGAQQQQVQALQKCIEERVMISQPNINVSDYFDIATTALDGIHAQYDQLVGSSHVA